jgi:fructose-bisphosphate aldolase, class II
MLVTMGELVKAGRAGGYAVGAFNVNSIELALGVLEAAVEKRSPVILAVADFPPTAPLSMEIVFRHCAELAKISCVPVALNLDHGRTINAVVRAIKSGATNVMLDASTKSFEENVALTRQAAELAHMASITCEGEIGHVGQGTDYASIDQDRTKLFTQPAEAIEFVEKTGVDALAVAVGTAHGHYVGTPKLDFELLARLREQLAIPLVLHGGSSTGDENLSRASKLGVAKVNIATDMATAARDRIVQLLAKDPKSVRLPQIQATAKLAYKEVSAHYMDVFGSTGKA